MSRSSPSKPTLIVFAKAPRIGAGKTRLAREIGAVEALRVNRWLHVLCLRRACDPRWRTLIAATPDAAVRVAPRTWPSHVRRMPQGGGDLGARLARALARHRKVAVIGVDCPDLTRARIWAAFRALRHAPFAIGPSVDGGFTILAARDGQAAARAMTPVRWSTAYACADVVRNLGGAVVATLQTLRDVDTAADLRAQRAATRWSSAR
jgi:hypothetical protein